MVAIHRLATLLVVCAMTASALELTVTNKCAFTVWLATTPNFQIPPLPDGEVRLDTGNRYVYSIANAGWAGRFWPKYGCDDAGTNCLFGQSSAPCPSDGCQPPADTKIEFNFPPQPPTSDSWYDISLVDGYSLPMEIIPRGINQGSCIATNCAMSLDDCPQDETTGLGDLRVIKNGQTVACLAPCKKWNYPPPYGFGFSETVDPGVMFCCPTPPVSPLECRTGPVIATKYVNLIHASCPTAYSYAYDDEGGLHNCPEIGRASCRERVSPVV
jgi:hypothetical protein